MRPTCPVCNKISVPLATLHNLDGTDLISLKCGHELIVPLFPRFEDWDKIRSRHGKSLYPFQARSCNLARDASMRFVCTHRMGLGKCIICCALIRRYHPILGKTLIICKANLTVQWMMELFEWSSIMAQRIETSKEPLHHDSFDVFIVSMDMLREVPWRDKETFKTVIMDEVQNLKNPDAQRTKAAMSLAKRADYVWGLSGTPVKNHMAEYFPILNMVRPDIFPTETGFISNYVECYNNGYGFQYGGARNLRGFHEKTKDFVFGFTREEVMPELPTVRRTFRFLDLEKGTDDAYRKTLVRWKDAYFDKGSTAQERFVAKGKQREEMMRLYQIVGMAKVRPTIDFIEEFLDAENGNNTKITLFIEHIAVGDLLENGINKLLAKRALEPCVRMLGGIDANESTRLESLFKNHQKRRILIASTRGCGEGKNFQFCSHAVMVERQWNAANEEQAECRFTRIGSTAESIDVTYMVARKTMDEAHAQLVEKKREISHKAVGENVDGWQKSDLMVELMAIMAKEV